MGPNLWSDSNTQKQRTYRNNISRKDIVRWRYKLVPGLLYSMCIFVSQICQLGSQLCVLNTTYINIHQTPYSHTAQQNMLAWHHHNFIPACTNIHTAISHERPAVRWLNPHLETSTLLQWRIIMCNQTSDDQTSDAADQSVFDFLV